MNVDAPADLSRLFAPRSIAVVGASATPGKIGHTIMANLTSHRYAGDVMAVNPGQTEICGVPSYPSLEALPVVPDLVVLVVPAGRSLEQLTACGETGVPFAMMVASGFAETSPEGARLQRECVEVARAYGTRIVGPNCQSLVNVELELMCGFGAVLTDRLRRVGGISIASQSGGWGLAAAALAQRRGLGHRHIASLGNQADLDLVDMVRYFVDDPETSVIGLYSEGATRGAAFGDVARSALEARKPIVMLRAGRTEEGRRAAMSHTATMATGDGVAADVARQLGIALAGDLDDFTDLCQIFSMRRFPAGRGVGVVTISGGMGVVMTDHLAALGMAVPLPGDDTCRRMSALMPDFAGVGNPLDLTGEAIRHPQLRSAVLEMAVDDDRFDSIVVINGQLAGRHGEAFVREIVRRARATDKPVVVVWDAPLELVGDAYTVLEEAGIPRFSYPSHAARALAALCEYADRRQDLLGDRDAGPAGGIAETVRRWARRGAAGLTEFEAKALLAEAGLPRPDEHLAATAEEAVGRATELGYPVVLKINSRTHTHKTDVGGVALDIRDPDQVRQSAERLLKLCAKLGEEPSLLVAPMATDVIAEVIVGATAHQEFGPVVMVGGGGVFAEVLDDVVFLQAPANRSQIRRAISALRCFPTLLGFRSAPHADVDALVDVVHDLGRLVANDDGALASVDLNPVLMVAGRPGVFLADAVVRFRDGEQVAQVATRRMEGGR